MVTLWPGTSLISQYQQLIRRCQLASSADSSKRQSLSLGSLGGGFLQLYKGIYAKGTDRNFGSNCFHFPSRPAFGHLEVPLSAKHNTASIYTLRMDGLVIIKWLIISVVVYNVPRSMLRYYPFKNFKEIITKVSWTDRESNLDSFGVGLTVWKPTNAWNNKNRVKFLFPNTLRNV